MGYLLIYIIMLIVGYYTINKFNLMKREVLELLSLPIAILMIIAFLAHILSGDFSFDGLLGVVVTPFLLAFIVVLFLPLLLVPTLLILILKKYYGDDLIFFFTTSSLIGGFTLSIIDLKLEFIVIGMSLALFSVLIQYYYFDRKREEKKAMTQ